MKKYTQKNPKIFTLQSLEIYPSIKAEWPTMKYLGADLPSGFRMFKSKKSAYEFYFKKQIKKGIAHIKVEVA